MSGVPFRQQPARCVFGARAISFSSKKALSKISFAAALAPPWPMLVDANANATRSRVVLMIRIFHKIEETVGKESTSEKASECGRAGGRGGLGLLN